MQQDFISADTGSPIADTSAAPMFNGSFSLFSSNKMTSLSLYDYPVPENLAQECVDEYQNLYHKNFNAHKVQAAFTDFVAFDAMKIKNWIDGNDIFHNAQFLVLKFGVYTDSMIKEMNSDTDPDNDIDPSKAGRLTIFIWPMINDGIAGLRTATLPGGAVIDPYNIGSLHP